MATPLTLTATLSSPVIPVTGQIRMVYALLELGGGAGPDALPVNLSLVLDASDSMRIRLVSDEQFRQLAQKGQAVEILTDGVPAYQIANVSPEMVSGFPRRIDYVRQALREVSEHLRGMDSFSVTAFASQAMTLIPKTSGRERTRLYGVADQLDWLNLGDETQMADGLSTGLDDLHPGENDGAANRMIVLTDGFTRNAQQCYDLAQRARQAGVTLSTMGVGAEFNEELLIPLADATGGNAYYIETPEKIPEAFKNELGTALAVTCHNLEIKVQLTPGVELRKVQRVLPLIGDFDAGPNDGGSYSLFLGDYDPSLPPALLLELVIPPWQAETYRLAQLLLGWDDPEQSAERLAPRSTVRGELAVQLSASGEEQRVGRVFNIVEKVGAFKLGTVALQAAERGDVGAATLKLRQAATRLMDMGETDLANDMLRQADFLERRGQADPNTTKHLRYATRQITKNKSA